MMRLFWAPASPFVRKVRVAIVEKQLDGGVDLVDAAVSPIAGDPLVANVNPLGKIPCLVLGDDRALFDSRVITRFLDIGR